MECSTLNKKRTIQECMTNMKTRDLTISLSEVKKFTENFILNYEDCKSEDASFSRTQSTCLQDSQHDSKDWTPPRKIMKLEQSLTFTEQEILKQPNDDSTYCSEEYGDADDRHEYNGTGDSQKDKSVYDSQGDYDTNDSKEDYDTNNRKEDDGLYDSEANDDTDEIQEDDDTEYSEGDDYTYDGKKDTCNKENEANMFHVKHETDVSEGGEADLHIHLNSCEKNPGHTRFVPVNDFNVNHMPDGRHDKDLAELIKATANLTVRVAVRMTSTKRPECCPNTTILYAFYHMRGSDVMRVGTGTVWHVNKEYNKGTCRCHKCRHSDTPSNVWGVVWMCTATHVVFDDLEARHTTCRLFYDREDSPLVTLDGWTVSLANIYADWCLLKCVTCDLDLLNKLEKMWRYWGGLCKKVTDKYKSSRDKVKLTFIASHPHGCSKQISVGHWINRYMVDEYSTKYTYTTCTCPGSSGANVHSLGYDDGWLYYRHVHSGVDSDGNNLSGVGREDS